MTSNNLKNLIIPKRLTQRVVEKNQLVIISVLTVIFGLITFSGLSYAAPASSTLGSIKSPFTPTSTTTTTTTVITPEGSRVPVKVVSNGDVRLSVPATIQQVVNGPNNILSVQYYLNNKLLETVKTPPYTYSFNTKTILNGTYTFTAKTSYISGRTTSSTQGITIANPFSSTQFRLALQHSGVVLAIVLVVIVLAAIFLFRHKLGFSKRANLTVSTAESSNGLSQDEGNPTEVSNPTSRSWLSRSRLDTAVPAFIIVVGLAVLGYHLISPSQADTIYGSVAASSGTLTGSATVETDSTASQGKSVVFGTASTTTSPPSNPSGPVGASDSKANCIEYDQPNGDIADSQLTALTAALGVTFNCVTTYNQPMTTWAEWDTPWMFTGGYGWNSWLAESPSHQVIMAEDLIPSSIENNSDPLTWEQQCDSGDFNTYATALGQDLVKEGAGSIMIRLGIEANGTWETDYVGNTTQEQNDWASCYDQEVTAMRAVPSSHFLFVWNPNICTANLPLNEWYPGNSYVDIIGADAYDIDCDTSKTVSQEGWSAYYNDSSANSPNNPDFPSLANIVSFAAANNKPFALPEWGEATNEPDDATYVTDMANIVKNNDTSYQSWFDDGSSGTEELGSAIPLSTTAYEQAFGN